MKPSWKSRAGWLLGCAILTLAASDRGEAEVARHAGLVIAVDKAAGTLVVGDMGPLLSGGKSTVTRFTVHVTPSTEFVRVKRASSVAPNGWLGDYVETKLPPWDVKPGDFVAIMSDGDGQRRRAVKITVVDTSEP